MSTASIPVSVGRPGKARRSGGAARPGAEASSASGGGSGKSIDDWSRCVKQLSVSSRESHALRLVDGSDSFWQSSGSQGRHWIRLAMQPDIVVERLFMRVDPADSSYMPSVLVIKAGDAPSSVNKELRTVHVSANDTLVTLLQDVQDVRHVLQYTLCFHFTI